MLKYWFAGFNFQKDSMFRIKQPNFKGVGELSVCLCVCRCHRCWICCVRLHCSVCCFCNEWASDWVDQCLLCAHHVLFVCCWIKLKLWKREICVFVEIALSEYWKSINFRFQNNCARGKCSSVFFVRKKDVYSKAKQVAWLESEQSRTWSLISDFLQLSISEMCSVAISEVFCCE